MFGGSPSFRLPDRDDPDRRRNRIERKIIDKQRELEKGFTIEDTIFASAAGTSLEDERRKRALTPRTNNK